MKESLRNRSRYHLFIALIIDELFDTYVTQKYPKSIGTVNP